MQALTKATIEISILDESSRRDCDAGCGMDWSSPDVLALASEQVRHRFGNEAHLAYLDLSHGARDQQARDWRQAIRERNLSVPLLLINGHLRIAGQFDIRQVVDAVEAELEIGK